MRQTSFIIQAIDVLWKDTLLSMVSASALRAQYKFEGYSSH